MKTGLFTQEIPLNKKKSKNILIKVNGSCYVTDLKKNDMQEIIYHRLLMFSIVEKLYENKFLK